MRVFRYLSSEGGSQPRMAVAVADHAPVDLLDAWSRASSDDLDPESASFLVSPARLIDAGPEVWKRVSAVAAEASESLDPVDPARVRWLCPLDSASSLRDFLAFEDHVKHGAERRNTTVPDYWYEAPVYYKGNHRSLIGPDEVCPWPRYSEEVDFELELALIVGKRGRDVILEDAPQHIFGFTVMNDFSARDVQRREMSAWLGPAKGKDFATALGPCIVTVDEVGAEPDLEMICRVNGEEWGRARSSQMYWPWARMLAHVSADEDIYPGDVYGSGTPGGCCGLDLGRKLDPGDEVELEIERIGVLRNRLGERDLRVKAR